MTRRRAAPVICLVPNGSGGHVTYLRIADVADAVGVSAGAVNDWAVAGAVRSITLRGVRHVALADAARVRRLTPAQRHDAGLRCTPAWRAAQRRAYAEAKRNATLPVATHHRDEWDEYDTQVVMDRYLAGHAMEDVAHVLGRTYVAVLDRLEWLRQQGELPRVRAADDGSWLPGALHLLTPAERRAVTS